MSCTFVFAASRAASKPKSGTCNLYYSIRNLQITRKDVHKPVMYKNLCKLVDGFRLIDIKVENVPQSVTQSI